MDNLKPKKKGLSIIYCAVLIFFSASLFFVGRFTGPRPASIFMPIADGPEAERPSYTVWIDSGMYYANDSNGKLVNSSTSASGLINWAMQMANRNGGGTVELLRGTYYLKNPLFLQTNVHLRGESAELTKITVANSTSPVGFPNFYALTGIYNPLPIINAEMSDLTVDPNSKGTTFSFGIFVANSLNYYLKVHDCNFPEGGSNSGAAIALHKSISAEIYNNTMFNQMLGIYLANTNYTNVHDNYLDTSTWEGFYFDKECYYNVISGNTIKNASYWHPLEHEGLEMHGSCKYNIVENNNFQFCINAIWEAGQANIIRNNHFNSVYNGIYVAPHDGVSEDIIQGNHIQNATHVGIGIQDGSNLIVASNFLEGDSVSEGLRAYNSNNVTFSANQVKSVYNGITLFRSKFCTVSGNDIATSIYGVYGGNGSDYNTIVSNNINENGYGVELYYSSNNKFYHNNFVNNTYEVSVRGESYANVWDDGYSSAGNYWSSYTDIDEYSGPNQDQPGSDYIWDHPYVIEADNQDHYPLINKWSIADVNHDGTVNVDDAAVIIAHWYPGPPIGLIGYDPSFDFNGDGTINIVDMAIVSAYWTGPPKGPVAP